MRSLLVAALLILSLAPLPGAAAKPLAEDPSGDVQVEVFGLGGLVAAPAGLGEPADLLSIDLVEDAEAVTFTLAVVNLKQTMTFSGYQIHFTWGKDEYLVVVRRSVMEGLIEDNSYAYLVNLDESSWEALAELDHTIDVENGLITVHLPKPYLVGENGKYPLLGDTLSDVYVEARSYLTALQFSADAYDRMPDGEETQKYSFLFGDVAAGKLRLDANERVRVSNGGATTFVYQVEIQNKADFDDDVSITLGDMPEGWNGTVQSPVRVPADSERRVAILVSVPFAHDHGGFSSFNVTVTSESDAASYASIRMGVLHTPIPQPAGHHADLYLHAENFNGGIFGQLFPWTGAFMNTDSAHETDALEASPMGDGDRLMWHIPLNPTLRMGLDFDVERLGEIVGSITGHSQTTGKVYAELLLYTPDGEDGTLLGDTDEQDITLTLNAPAPFKLTFTPTEEADYIPYLRGQNVALMLYYEPSEEGIGSICCLPGATPGLMTADFKATLPLNEYHDKLSGLSEAGDMLELKALGPVEKAGLPGATMTYLFTLTNRGTSDEVIDIDLAGTDAALGTIVPSGAIKLGAKESRELTLAVSIPTDRNEGEELEVLIFAHAQEDPSKSAISRTKTIVGKQGSADVVADESELLTAARERETNDAPAPGALVVLSLVGAAAFMMRRRDG